MHSSRPIHLPSIEGLRAVEATARLCSFERAALELSLTPSAVSKRVMTLERLLGVALFTRKANSLLLTEAGTIYVDQAREVLRMLTVMHRDARLEMVQRLKVTSTPTFARQILAPHLISFSERHPDIELELIVIAPLPDAPATGADVEIRHGRIGASHGAPLMSDVITPMAAPQYIRSSPPVRSPADLRQLTWLNTPFESWTPWLQVARLDGEAPKKCPKFLDLGLTYEAAVKGQGVAMCRPSLVGDWLERGDLQPLFDIYATPPGHYYLLPGSARDSAETFMGWLRSLCNSLAERNLRIARDRFSKPHA